MNNQDIGEKVIKILAKKLAIDPSSITGETRLAEDLGVDSFGGVELMFEIESAFSLNIPDSEIEQIRKVKDIVDYIKEHLNGKPTT